MNIESIEYLSKEPYINIVLKDFVSKYISDLKNSTIAEVTKGMLVVGLQLTTVRIEQ